MPLSRFHSAERNGPPNRRHTPPLSPNIISANTVWLDAGCGSRLLEDDLDPLEDWLATQCKTLISLDLAATSHRNIKVLVQGTLDHLPFADSCLDLVTCRMVVEHLDQPVQAFAEIYRCTPLAQSS